jgi:hypothetical protein
MVEQFLAAYSGRYTRFQVWQRLPRKVMYQTYQVILSYLETSGKIRTEYGGKILWNGPEKPPKIPTQLKTELIAK